MNLKIKFRESFRPFAPCVSYANTSTNGFDMRPNEDSPYMLLVAPVLGQASPSAIERRNWRKCGMIRILCGACNIMRSSVPAVTHVDYSARIQTIDERHGRFQRLMQRVLQKDRLPYSGQYELQSLVGANRCEPPRAYHTFMQSEMDVLVLGDFVLQKSEQPLLSNPGPSHGMQSIRSGQSLGRPGERRAAIVTSTWAHQPGIG